jgi:spermidine/putrescine transport system substrate-binding protein
MTRRSALARGGAAALGLSGLLAACSNSTSPSTPKTAGGSQPVGPGGILLPRIDKPGKMPVYAGNPMIASGLAPEKNATLQVYNWDAYLNQAVIKDFERKYNCKVELSTFTTLDEGLAKVTAKTTQFDVYFPAYEYLVELVAGQVVQPLNHSYLPNLKNIWPTLQSPWYDVGARYTVPYTVWTTGIAWRNDKLPNFNPDSMANPYDIFWQSTSIPGRVALLDDLDAMTMTMLRNGITNLGESSPKVLSMVQRQLLQLVSSVNVKFDNTEYTDLPNGSVWLHQAWSGDVISVPYYMPKGLSPKVISYWFPKDGKGEIGNDTIAVLKGAKSPVLAHLFLNHILDYKQALLNMQYTGYQQPQTHEDPNHLIAEGLVNPAQASCIAREIDFKNGYQPPPLTTAENTAWENTWATVKAGG